MKKWLSLLLVMVLTVLMFTGCSNHSGHDEPDPDNSRREKLTINIASTFPDKGFLHDGMEIFKDYMNKHSNGRIEVVIHPNGAMGTTRETCEGLRTGTIEMGAMGDEYIDYYCPEYSCLAVPYVYRDAKHYFDFLDKYGDWLFGEIQKKSGVVTGTWLYRGARDITANKKIVEPEDLKGLKFRLPSAPVRVAVFSAYGATPTVVDFGELYMALKTGMVDAQENPPETIFTYKYYEAQRYLILSQHIQASASYVISEKWFNGLSEEDQSLIMEAWDYVHEQIMKKNPDPDKEYIDKCKEAGMELVVPNTARFIELAEPVIEKWAAENWVPGLLEKINSV